MNDIVTPKQFAALSEDEQFYYDPDYHKYKVTKYRDYETCDLGHEHFMGWRERRIPVGEPYQYIRDNSLARHTLKLMQPAIIDQVTNSNVIMNRVLNKKGKWNA